MDAAKKALAGPPKRATSGLTDDQRIFWERVILAAALPGVAGAVNASGFLALGTYTSHVTGHVARIGDELARGGEAIVAGIAVLLAVFLAGAICATGLVERAKRFSRARYATPILLEAAALMFFAVWAGYHPAGVNTLALTCLLCFAMGLQNALVTKISGAEIRTTHLTGVLTDIGIESVRLGLWLLREHRRRRLIESLDIWHGVYTGGEWKRLRLHLLVFFSFTSGAMVGPQLFVRYGQRAMAAPCFVLLTLALFDFAFGLRPRDGAVPRAATPG
jgi:uncharacterized membrane protein YoaK (UPF0700 family)